MVNNLQKSDKMFWKRQDLAKKPLTWKRSVEMNNIKEEEGYWKKQRTVN